MFAALEASHGAWAVCSTDNVARADYQRAGRLLGEVEMRPTALLDIARIRAPLRRRVAERGSIVHVTMHSPLDLLLLPSRQQTDAPVLFTVHDHERHAGHENALVEGIERWVIEKRVDHLVTLSRFVYDEMRKRSFDIPLHFVEGGLATRATPGLAPRDGMKGSCPKLLFLGRINIYKGIDVLLDALRILVNRGIDFECTIAGSGDADPYLPKIKALPQVTLINEWLTEAMVETLLADGDLLVLPYLEATQSGVAIDAQWAAIPTVATPVGALPEQFGHGETAELTADLQPHSLADSIEKLLKNPDLFAAMSRAAHAAYRDKDLPAISVRWEELYRQIGRR
ncbi:glycosyltransferase family 4 protein [Sphingopyxis kveilinensis]|uniref:glycosyltransferase family 4 protein n=1 Tax=Sphingopyxis kveilinensis TaxID=3114367 RepID=UPI0030CD02E2